MIIGLDISLSGTGICQHTPFGVRWEVFGTAAKAPKGKTVPPHEWELTRMAEILGKVTPVCTNASMVVIEDFAFGLQGSGARSVAGLTFLIRYWLWKNKIPFVLAQTSQLKKFVAGRSSERGPDKKMRGVPKEVIIREIFERWGHRIDDNNAADACGLMYIGLALMAKWEPQTNPQRDVVTEIRNKFSTVLDGVK